MPQSQYTIYFSNKSITENSAHCFTDTYIEAVCIFNAVCKSYPHVSMADLENCLVMAYNNP